MSIHPFDFSMPIESHGVQLPSWCERTTAASHPLPFTSVNEHCYAKWRQARWPTSSFLFCQDGRSTDHWKDWNLKAVIGRNFPQPTAGLVSRLDSAVRNLFHNTARHEPARSWTAVPFHQQQDASFATLQLRNSCFLFYHFWIFIAIFSLKRTKQNIIHYEKDYPVQMDNLAKAFINFQCTKQRIFALNVIPIFLLFSAGATDVFAL